VGSARHVLMEEGSTNVINGNENVFFVVRKGPEQQECGNGGAIRKMGWY